MNTLGTRSTKHVSFISHNNKMVYLLVIGILISETIALAFLKEYSVNANLIFYFCGLFFYAIVTMFLVKSFRYEGMGVVNVLWSAFSIMFVVASGMIFFKEKVHVLELLGIVMVLGGVSLIRIFE